METVSGQALAQNKPISNGILGMVLALVTELMFFAGLISAYIVNRAGVTDWPPIGQPRLPVEITAYNTLFLLFSAFTVYMVTKKYQSGKKPMPWLLTTIILGFLFVGIQGYEWINLLSYGLTTSSGIYGAFFYAIIGMHGFHVLIGTGFLVYMWMVLQKNVSEDNTLRKIKACSLFWYFVVGIWPVLYFLVYLM